MNKAEPSQEPEHKETDIKATEENHLLRVEQHTDGISISQENSENFIYIYPSQYKAFFNILEDEVFKIERAKATARVEERERKKEQARAKEEERKDLIFNKILETAKENGHQEPTQAETEQAQTQSDLNLSKYCEGLK